MRCCGNTNDEGVYEVLGDICNERGRMAWGLLPCDDTAMDFARQRKKAESDADIVNVRRSVRRATPERGGIKLNRYYFVEADIITPT